MFSQTYFLLAVFILLFLLIIDIDNYNCLDGGLDFEKLIFEVKSWMLFEQNTFFYCNSFYDLFLIFNKLHYKHVKYLESVM